MQTRSKVFASAIAASLAGGALYFNVQSNGAAPQNATKADVQSAPRARIAAAPATTPSCTISETVIIDGWKAADDSTEYEQIAFSMEDGKREFSTWMHERPEIVGGSWSLTGCTLTLDAPYAAVNKQSYGISMPNADTLWLIPPDDTDYAELRFARVK